MGKVIRIGSRGSRLAMAQTELVAAALRELCVESQTQVIKTTGDSNQGTPRARGGDKRDWIDMLEQAVVEGQIDLAIHSGKDVPAEIDPRTQICSVLRRGNPFDVLVRPHSEPRLLALADLPPASLVGTCSVRRKAQIKRLRPDLRVTDVRGNVPTRLTRLDMDRELAGIILAAAGIERLQILGLNSLLLEGVIPAVNQGVLVAQYRGADLGTQEIIFALRDRATEVCFQAERECIQLLNADCHSALGVFARISGSLLTIEASVLSPEGDREVSAVLEGSVSEPAQLGTLLAKRLEQEGARELLGAAAR